MGAREERVVGTYALPDRAVGEESSIPVLTRNIPAEECLLLPGQAAETYAKHAMAPKTSYHSMHAAAQGPLHACGRRPDPNGGDRPRGWDTLRLHLRPACGPAHRQDRGCAGETRGTWLLMACHPWPSSHIVRRGLHSPHHRAPPPSCLPAQVGTTTTTSCLASVRLQRIG